MIQQEHDQQLLVLKQENVILSERIKQLIAYRTGEIHLSNMRNGKNSELEQILEVSRFFKKIKAWGVQNLKISGNYVDQLRFSRALLKIEDIKFTQLKSLNLWRSQIMSVENINRIWMPKLEELWLEDNKIFSIKSIAKCFLPQLKKIGIRGNPIKDCHCFQIMYAPEMQSMNIQFWREDPTIGQDDTWIFKISFDKINILHLDSVRRIYQYRSKSGILRKFANSPNFEFHCHEDYE